MINNKFFLIKLEENGKDIYIKPIDFILFISGRYNHENVINHFTTLASAIEYYRYYYDKVDFSKVPAGNKNVQCLEGVVADYLEDESSWDLENDQVLIKDISGFGTEEELRQAVENINELLGTEYKVCKSIDYPYGYWIYLEF